jgi:hypothetical protein
MSLKDPELLAAANYPEPVEATAPDGKRSRVFSANIKFSD